MTALATETEQVETTGLWVGDSFRGIVTRSRREVSINEGVPSLLDIAIALAQQTRFAGHTVRWWSVLDHSLFVARLAEKRFGWMGSDDHERELRLAALLHDAHEAATNDTPTPFKKPTLRLMQDRIDERLMDAYFPGGYKNFLTWVPTVKTLDRIALLAEARVIGPHRDDAAVERYFGALPETDAVAELEWALAGGDLGVHPGTLVNPEEAPNVRAFLAEYVRSR